MAKRFRMVNLSTLSFVASNPREISQEKFSRLMESIRQHSHALADWRIDDGFRLAATITVNRQGMRVVGGEQRIKALQSLGQNWIHGDDITLVDLRPGSAIEKRLCIELNNREAQGDFTPDLAKIVAEIEEQLPQEGDPLGLQALLDSASQAEGADMSSAASEPGRTDPDAAPVARQPYDSAKGEVYVLGQHRLICDDVATPETVDRLTQGTKADLLLTDPPYNVAYEGKTEDGLTIANDDMDPASYRRFLATTFSAASRVMRPGASFYIWHADTFGFLVRAAARDAGFSIRQCLVLVKPSLVLGRSDYHWRHEPCLYGWKDGGGRTWNGGRCKSTVFEFERPMRSADHPTMKPVGLIAEQLENSTRKGGVVLDIFGGSGSTLIAAERSGRRAFLSEISPRYCDVIRRRWAEFVYGDGCNWPRLAPPESRAKTRSHRKP